MVNPHLRDAVDRVIRDPQRKLGWDDRLIGTLRLVRQFGGQPRLYALGAAAARLQLNRETQPTPPPEWADLWGADPAASPEGRALIGLIDAATSELLEKGL
jgi:mannitol-1-phosphate/altronate dehydrogenase